MAERLGQTCHVSPLRMKLHRLWQRSRSDAPVLEDWLVDVANGRGARIVVRKTAAAAPVVPTFTELTNEELVVGLLLPQNRDRPQILRLAAQLISREAVNFRQLTNLAIRERVGFILAELARQACKVESNHPLWTQIHRKFRDERAPASSLLHYTRLAEPGMKNGGVSDGSWALVS